MLLKHKSFLIAWLLLFFTVPLAAWQVIDFSAFPKTDGIDIRWEIRSGADIQTIVLQKSTDDYTWRDLQSFAYTGDGTVYNYRDTDITGKTNSRLDTQSTYYYRIKVIKKDGSEEFSASIIARPSYSGIQRTWGSLKALFR